MRRMSRRWRFVIAGVLGTLGATIYAWAHPCPAGMDTCAGRPECTFKTFHHQYTKCDTVIDSNNTPWCCRYSVVVYTCGGGGRCSISSLSSVSSPCNC